MDQGAPLILEYAGKRLTKRPVFQWLQRINLMLGLWPLAWLFCIYLLYYGLYVRLGVWPKWDPPNGRVSGPLYVLTQLMFEHTLVVLMLQIVVVIPAVICHWVVRDYRGVLLACVSLLAWLASILAAIVNTPPLSYWLNCTFD